MNRLSALLEDAADGPVGFDHHDIGVRVRRRQRRSRVAVVSLAVLFVGAALVGTSLGNGADQVIDATGTPEEQSPQALAEYLLTDAIVEEQFPDLSRSDTTRGNRDYAVLGDTELSGPAEDAVAGVARQWSQPYSWSAGDPVSNQLINVASTAIGFPSSDDADSAAAEVLGLLDVAQAQGAMEITSDRFEGFCEPAGTDPDPRTCLAATTVGNVVVTVQMDFAGTGDRLDVFEQLLDSAVHQLPNRSVSPTTETTISSALDGPVMRYPDSGDDGAEHAQIRGTLELEGDCLYVARDSTRRFPIVWPAGTAWDAESESVIGPSMTPMPVGSEVHGGGGYHKVDDVGRVLGAEAEALAARCVDNTYGEIAFVNNGDDAIRPGPGPQGLPIPEREQSDG